MSRPRVRVIKTRTITLTSMAVARVIGRVTRCFTSRPRWKESKTESAGNRSSIRVGGTANRVSSAVSPEIVSNHTPANGV